MKQTELQLEFNVIKEQLAALALSEKAKEKLLHLKPYLSEGECKRRINETTEARKLLDTMGNPPLPEGKGIPEILAICETGACLIPEQLYGVSLYIAAGLRMKKYLERCHYLGISLSSFSDAIYELKEVKETIDGSVTSSEVLDSASPTLRNIRRKLETVNDQIKRKLEDLLRNQKSIFSDGYISMKNGRFVLPVKKDQKGKLPGSVIEVSNTGGTCFIEPAAIDRLSKEMEQLKIQEELEIQTILYTLTDLVQQVSSQLAQNVKTMTILDVLFAKAKLSADQKAIAAAITTDRKIAIKNGRHPLLNQEECVPLNFAVGGDATGIVITGPNTGGKTVALKTVGLLSLMAQSGLHVPVESGSFTMNNLVLCDMGDGQSISENLSTFSSHIRNVIDILNSATDESLVLLDELGSGTDPAEGMGIAIAILEELKNIGCLFVATTHYPEVKEYAKSQEGIENARMAFDKESLKPLYRLEIGEAGESCALYIAKRLGLPDRMIERARQAAYHGEITASRQFEETHQPSLPKPSSPRIQKQMQKKPENTAGTQYQMGDSVTISPENEVGIVYQPVDDMGMVWVQVKKEKKLINHKRLTLKVAASELYPPDYDFSIIFDSVENRKLRHQMGRKYVEGGEISL